MYMYEYSLCNKAYVCMCFRRHHSAVTDGVSTPGGRDYASDIRRCSANWLVST